MKESIFNTFHDGTVTAIKGPIPGDVTLTIDCEYLRKRIPTVGKDFIVKFANCKKLRFKLYDETQPELTNTQDIAAKELEILSAKSSDNTVIVCCGNGDLSLEFESASIWLNQYEQISQYELEKIARAYWDEFGKEG